MDAARPMLTRRDGNEDSRPDRWEYSDAGGRLEKVGFSRRDDGNPDARAFGGADGRVERIGMSSASKVTRIDRWEHYDATGLVRAEEDTNADGTPDQ